MRNLLPMNRLPDYQSVIVGVTACKCVARALNGGASVVETQRRHAPVGRIYISSPPTHVAIRPGRRGRRPYTAAERNCCLTGQRRNRLDLLRTYAHPAYMPSHAQKRGLIPS